MAPDARPGDLVRPGHIFPLRARDGGVLVRTGQTEGSVDLARMAGLMPAGVICEIMKDDGTMARRPDLLRFARKHKLTMLSVADLIRYRMERERLVRRVATEALELRGAGDFEAFAYRSDVDPLTHVALVKGDLSGPEPVLTRVHRACLVGDLFGSRACGCHAQLEESFQQIREAGRGVIVYLQKQPAPDDDLPLHPRLQRGGGAGPPGPDAAARVRGGGADPPRPRAHQAAPADQHPQAAGGAGQLRPGGRVPGAALLRRPAQGRRPRGRRAPRPVRPPVTARSSR